MISSVTFFFCKSSFYSFRHGFPCKHKLRVTDYFCNSCVSIIQVGTSWLVCGIEVYRAHSLLRQLVSFLFQQSAQKLLETFQQTGHVQFNSSLTSLYTATQVCSTFSNRVSLITWFLWGTKRNDKSLYCFGIFCNFPDQQFIWRYFMPGTGMAFNFYIFCEPSL